MWMIVVVCAAASNNCSLYNNLGNLNSYAYRLYASKQDCMRDGTAIVKKWTEKDGGTYTYYCQNTSSPAPPPN